VVHVLYLLELCVTDDLEHLIVEMAREQAHHHHCSLAKATRQIRSLVAKVREEYRAASTLYGDDAHSFCRCLLARLHLTG